MSHYCNKTSVPFVEVDKVCLPNTIIIQLLSFTALVVRQSSIEHIHIYTALPDKEVACYQRDDWKIRQVVARVINCDWNEFTALLAAYLNFCDTTTYTALPDKEMAYQQRDNI